MFLCSFLVFLWYLYVEFLWYLYLGFLWYLYVGFLRYFYLVKVFTAGDCCTAVESEERCIVFCCPKERARYNKAPKQNWWNNQIWIFIGKFVKFVTIFIRKYLNGWGNFCRLTGNIWLKQVLRLGNLCFNKHLFIHSFNLLFHKTLCV